MNTANTVYVGIKGSVVALDRSSGEILWQTHLKGSEFVHVVAAAEDLLAVTVGELFCLEAATGSLKWHNPLKGFGTGLASLLVPVPGSVQDSVAVLTAELRRREDAARAAAASTPH